MAVNRGKQFETKIREDLRRCFPCSFVYRIPDQMTFYKGAADNPCDILFYNYPKLFLIEAKTFIGNTFGLTTFRQYEKLRSYKGIKGVYPGVLMWFQSHDKVVWVPITEIEKMVADGCKSVNIKMLDEGKYNIIVIPSVKKRVFMDSDYTKLMEVE